METITIKEEAAEQIDKLLSEEEERPYALRIFVVGGGCSGFEYGFSFEENGNAFSKQSFLRDFPP